MTPRSRRILRTTAGIVGTMATLMGIAMLCAFTAIQWRFYDPTLDYSAGIRSGFLYLGIGVISLVVVWRLRSTARNASTTSTGR